jgi:hypothetical protein
MAIPVPPASHPGWSELVAGRKKPALAYLAAKIFIGRKSVQLQGAAPEAVRAAAVELRELFAQNAECRSVQQDLQTIFG